MNIKGKQIKELINKHLSKQREKMYSTAGVNVSVFIAHEIMEQNLCCTFQRVKLLQQTFLLKMKLFKITI